VSLPDLPERLATLIEKYGVPGASVPVLADGEITGAVAGVPTSARAPRCSRSRRS